MHSLLRLYRSHRFACLFYSLLLTVAVAPLGRMLGLELLPWFLALNLFTAVLGATEGRLRRLLFVLAAVFALLRLRNLMLDDVVLLDISEAVWVTVCAVALARTLRHTLRGGTVDRERIYTALSVYVLAGMTFAGVYSLFERMVPGSFSMAGGPASFSFARACYFSFVTLASLGYGDIVPVSDAARGLAIVEVVGGQIYLTVLVARLVSLYVSHEQLAHDR